MTHPRRQHPATRRRGGDPDVKGTPASEKPGDMKERELEEGLEETMAGSDPVSVVQPAPGPFDKRSEDKRSG